MKYETKLQRRIATAVRFIQSHGGWVTKTQLTRRFNQLPAAERQELINAVFEISAIKTAFAAEKGPATTYITIENHHE